jgi:class 3 adenylate cyclase/HAMP domain-containing protein
VAQSGRTTDYRQDDETWWQIAGAEGVHVAEVEYDRSAGIYSTDIAVRVEDCDGAFLGVLKVVLNIEEAIKVIDEAQGKGLAEEQKPDAFKLLTRDGRVIYSTGEFDLFEDASASIPAEILGGEEIVPVGIFENRDERMGDLLCAFARSTGHRDFEGLGWILVLQHEKEKIHAPIAALRARIWWASVIAALLGLALGWLVSSSISRRIVRLQRGAEIIGHGSFDYKVGSEETDEVGQLSRAFEEMATNLKAITASRDDLNREIAVREQVEERLRRSRDESEGLLLNILPKPVADRLKHFEGAIADRFDDVTILFADIVGFTRLATHIPAIELVGILNEIFSGFDRLAERHGLEKIKTIGDTYMVVGGLPVPRVDHAEAVAAMALDMREALARLNEEKDWSFSIRVGIHSGPVVAGIIGVKKFSYDLWGDTVNTASRMEKYGLPDCIQVTERTYERLRESFEFEERGAIQVKGLGELTTYLLTGRRPGSRD